ncbi:MAG: ribosome recycling factor [Chloroflexi bacterium]|nr:ribosome recycling factor [Chloroflexota bacterium]
MLDENLIELDSKMKISFDVFLKDLSGMRTGRASTGLVENISVDYFGSEMPLNQLAQINVGDARLIVIQVWDKNAVDSISKAIQNSDLNLSPNVDGDLIRLNLPPLTEERRRDLVKVIKTRGEECKLSIRSARRDSQEFIRKVEKDGSASQDDCQRSQKKLQDITDSYVKKIDQEIKNKELEVMQV